MIVSIFYAYQFILRVMPNIILSDIVQKFHIDAAVLGQFSGVYYIGYACMHLPVGIMLDRYGPKRVMPVCIFFTVIGLLPLIFAENWIFPLMGRALIGMGSSAAILGVFKIIPLTFSRQHFTRMLSFSVTIGLVGAVYGGGPVNYLFKTFGYETLITMFAIAGGILVVVTYLTVPDLRESHETTIFADLKSVLGNSRLLRVCVYAGLMVGPMEGFADVWSAAFLKSVYGFDPGLAASLPSGIFIGMMFAPFLNFIAEKTDNYLGTIVGSGLLMGISFLALILGILPVPLMGCVFFLVGVCCAYQILAIYKASTYVDASVSGLAMTVANMIIMSFGYAFHTLIGSIVHAMGGLESLCALTWGIGIIPVTLGIGVMGFIHLLLQDKKPSLTSF